MRISDPVKFGNRVIKPIASLLALATLALVVADVHIFYGQYPVTGVVVFGLIVLTVGLVLSDHERRIEND